MIKSAFIKDGVRVEVEVESAQELAVVLAGAFSSAKASTPTITKSESVTPTKVPAKRGRPAKNELEKRYKRAPWMEEDVLAVARIVVDAASTKKATPRAYAYLKKHGKIRNRTYIAVQVFVSDLTNYLRTGRSTGKRIDKYLATAGFAAASMPHITVDGHNQHSAEHTLSEKVAPVPSGERRDLIEA